METSCVADTCMSDILKTPPTYITMIKKYTYKKPCLMRGVGKWK